MASVTAQDFINVMAITDDAEDIEYVMDLAIDRLNIYGADLDNMTGDAGSKTVTLTSAQRGAVFTVSRFIYNLFLKYTSSGGGSSSSVSLMGISKSQSTTLSTNPEVMDLAKECANQIKGRSFKRT